MMLSYASGQRCKTSEFHKTCIPAEVRQKAEQIITSGAKGDHKPLTETQVAKLNVVVQDAIWTERVVQEKNGNESWDANWAFLKDFDSQAFEFTYDSPMLIREIPNPWIYCTMCRHSNNGNETEVLRFVNRLFCVFESRKRKSGRHRSARKLPSRVNMYSDNIPNTQSGQYGSRLNTQEGTQIRSLEAKFMTSYRKEKLNSEMSCY